MWTREKHLNNFAANDPKGELYVKFYYPASRRGFDVIAFNLINPDKTNIYNPLGYAVDAARSGDNQKVEEFVSSIGDVFFPTEKADDPMWPNAANAAFKRSAFGMIDYYQEEDRELRSKAAKAKTPPQVLAQELDELWGHVTLYNVYQMMTQLASKKTSDPHLVNLGKESNDDDQDQGEDEEIDYLTLFFNATGMLPPNALRTSAANQDNSLRAMAGSDKTIASVYGISLTAMLFFTDTKIAALTSGRPSQNFDMQGLAFPRRIGIRFNHDYLVKNAMAGKATKWTAYKDRKFTDKYEGKDFEHQTNIDSNGWANFVFKGIFDQKSVYLKLEVFDSDSSLLMKTFYFKFTKGYRQTLDGRYYAKDPVSGEKIIHNGFLFEMQKQNDGTFVQSDTSTSIQKKSLLKDVKAKKGEQFKSTNVNINAISQVDIHYTEKPKAIFFITPPHLMSYAKIILILINQMFNMQVDKAYLTKANQKPLYKTRYMFDEVGNLQSEGNGIPYLNTKESIGLGQEQQYTLILQTLQQCATSCIVKSYAA